MPAAVRVVRTRPIEPPGALLDLPWRETPSVAWVRHGTGMLGFGIAAQGRFQGVERFSRAQRWVHDWIRPSRIEDEVGGTQSGPVAFGSFTFDDDSSGSVIVIPRVLIGIRGGHAWRTDVVLDDDPPADGLSDLLGAAPEPMPAADWQDESAAAASWKRAVHEAVKRIDAGEVDKVVLARSVQARFDRPVPAATLLAHLAENYPECWTFHVDGFVGATPELLVRRQRDAVSSRVLAGSIATRPTPAEDGDAAAELRTSSKNLAEHEYAVRSVAHVLAVHCTDLEVPSTPSVLRLANVQHLATDIKGNLADGSSALALAAGLHPTAAVCGTPGERARAVITELEEIDRGRYSGPVGWFDANGDGEFAIALRCASFDPSWTRAELFAGCGLVADSDPEAELAESEIKLAAMRDALG